MDDGEVLIVDDTSGPLGAGILSLDYIGDESSYASSTFSGA